MSSSEDNKAIVRRFLEALEQQDFEALKEHPGLYQTVQRQPMVRAAFPDLRAKIEQQIAEGDTVATRATMEGTHVGPFKRVVTVGERAGVEQLPVPHDPRFTPVGTNAISQEASFSPLVRVQRRAGDGSKG